jgi:hypothetical protein
LRKQPCPDCRGCGKVANSDAQEPWRYWEELKPPADLAVRLGIVAPIPCPRCFGSGEAPTPAGTSTKL